MKKKIILKVGGSLLYKKNLRLNALLLAQLREWYLRNREIYEKIVLVIGGGLLSRELGEKARKFVDKDDDINGIAMQTTILNAQMIKEILDEKDDDISVPHTLGEAFEFMYNNNIKVIISGGLKKGWSTDMDAAVFADTLQIDRVHKLSNVKCIFEHDPREKLENNECIRDISWEEYFKKFNIQINKSIHTPNENIPIDVIAAQYCFQKGISFLISGGELLKQYNKLDPILEAGTFIHS